MDAGFIFFTKQMLNVSYVIRNVLGTGDAKVCRTDESPG